MAGFTIIEDSLYKEDMDKGEESIFPSREGKVTPDYKGGKLKAKAYDDDDILYYVALCDGEEGAESFHDWSAYDSGSVLTKIYDPNKKEWVPFIG